MNEKPIPQRVLREVERILDREAKRIFEMHLYLAERRRERKPKLSPIEAEALALDTKYRRYTITRDEHKRLSELTSKWPDWRSRPN